MTLGSIDIQTHACSTRGHQAVFHSISVLTKLRWGGEMCGEEQPGEENFKFFLAGLARKKSKFSLLGQGWQEKSQKFPRRGLSRLAKTYKFSPKCTNSSPKWANSLSWREKCHGLVLTRCYLTSLFWMASVIFNMAMPLIDGNKYNNCSYRLLVMVDDLTQLLRQSLLPLQWSILHKDCWLSRQGSFYDQH